MSPVARRTLLAGGAGLTGLALTGISPALDAQAAGQLTDLGPAIRSVNVRTAGFGTLPDGTAIAFAISNGIPASFTVVELTTGVQLFAEELPDVTVGSWVLQQGADGDIYFSVRHPAPAVVYRFDVTTMSLHRLAEGVAGESVLSCATIAEDGVIWIGSYPHAKVISYDPATGEFTDHGSQTGDAAYTFSIGMVDGSVWAGTGPVPHLFVIDPASGDRRELHPPEHVMANTGWFIKIDQRGNDVLVRLSPRGTYDTAIYHLDSETWSEEIIPGCGGGSPTPITRSGDSFVLVDNADLVGYNSYRNQIISTDFGNTDLPALLAGTVNSYALGIVRVPELRLPGESVVGITTDGDLWFFNLPTSKTRVIHPELLANPAEAHGVGTGPDGQIYIGAYLSSGAMSRIDPDTHQVTALRGPKQGDAIISHPGADGRPGRIVVSSYPNAVVHLGDLNQEWDWVTNPHQVLELGRGEPYFQDRAFGLAAVGSLLAVGTIPDYGELGGALTILDPDSGEFTVHRHVVTDQSVISLAHRDGLIYGTTSIRGGLSSTPAAAEAKLFIWDVAAAQKLWEGTISPGAVNAGGLLWGPSGELVGSTSNGDLFCFDINSRTVTDLTPVVTAADWTGWGYAARTVYHEATDSFVGTQAGQLFQLRRSTGEATILSEDMEQIAQAGNGKIFGVNQTNAFLITPQ